MPIEEIKGILTAPDVGARYELIAAHLNRLEESLTRTQNAVASLQDLLDHPDDAARANISHRSVPAPGAAAITPVIGVDAPRPRFPAAPAHLPPPLTPPPPSP